MEIIFLIHFFYLILYIFKVKVYTVYLHVCVSF